MGICFHRGPLLGNMEGRSFPRALEIKRHTKRYVKMASKRVSVCIGAMLGGCRDVLREKEILCGFFYWTRRALRF
jgi:hypothetical protein